MTQAGAGTTSADCGRHEARLQRSKHRQLRSIFELITTRTQKAGLLNTHYCDGLHETSHQLDIKG